MNWKVDPLPYGTLMRVLFRKQYAFVLEGKLTQKKASRKILLLEEQQARTIELSGLYEWKSQTRFLFPRKIDE